MVIVLMISIPIVLVGNKTDLHMQRVISTEMGKKLASDWKASFVECSAKQNEGVEEIFQKILQQVEALHGNESEGSCIIL
jgi:Ras family protein